MRPTFMPTFIYPCIHPAHLVAGVRSIMAPFKNIKRSYVLKESRMIDAVIDLGKRKLQRIRVHTASLSKVNKVDGGIIAVTAKATANQSIAPVLFRFEKQTRSSRMSGRG